MPKCATGYVMFNLKFIGVFFEYIIKILTFVSNVINKKLILYHLANCYCKLLEKRIISGHHLIITI